VGAGDPSLVVDHETGRIFLFHAYGPKGIGFSNSGPGNADDSTTRAGVLVMADVSTYEEGLRAAGLGADLTGSPAPGGGPGLALVGPPAAAPGT
jgi:hypothetical protein